MARFHLSRRGALSDALPVLRFIDERPFHWCPACERLHPLPSDTDKWTFDGNLERPTFSPSFKQYLCRDGTRICHYVLTAGVLNYCADSTHSMAGQSVPLPPIPEGAE